VIRISFVIFDDLHVFNTPFNWERTPVSRRGTEIFQKFTDSLVKDNSHDTGWLVSEMAFWFGKQTLWATDVWVTDPRPNSDPTNHNINPNPINLNLNPNPTDACSQNVLLPIRPMTFL